MHIDTSTKIDCKLSNLRYTCGKQRYATNHLRAEGAWYFVRMYRACGRYCVCRYECCIRREKTKPPFRSRNRSWRNQRPMSSITAHNLLCVKIKKRACHVHVHPNVKSTSIEGKYSLSLRGLIVAIQITATTANFESLLTGSCTVKIPWCRSSRWCSSSLH